MLHYHGTPITPRKELEKMYGKNFCVSFASPQDIKWAVKNAQSVMLDNGAFSVWKRGIKFEPEKFIAWVEPYLGHPNWAVVPDVIDGQIEDNLKLINEWPHDKAKSCVVWHMHEPISHLLDLTQMGFGKIAFGSTKKYDPVGSKHWSHRADEAFNALSQNGPLPWVHMMRGLSLCGKRWPFASADSTNVARNFKNKGREKCPEQMSRRIDAIQSPLTWTTRQTQKDLFNAIY